VIFLGPLLIGILPALAGFALGMWKGPAVSRMGMSVSAAVLTAALIVAHLTNLHDQTSQLACWIALFFALGSCGPSITNDDWLVACLYSGAAFVAGGIVGTFFFVMFACAHGSCL
jgi:hypothetical protein